MYSRCGGLTSGTTYAGTRGHILIVFYTNSSAFASRVANSKLNEVSGNFMELLEAQDPPTNPEPKPKCKRYPYCSNSSQCRGALGCICVADKWHGEFWSTACKYPFPDLGRGLFEIGSVNATQASPFVNRTLAATSLGDTACPCNCTYVSKACCDSPAGIVYEGFDMNLGSVQAPSVNVTCNPTTGEFQTSNTKLDV